MSKKKKDREWRTGEGWKGTTRAAITHHPDKFDKDCKDPDKLCPYAIFSSMKQKGAKSHYKDQKSTLKGTPKKKKSFKEWLDERERRNISRLLEFQNTKKNYD